MWSWNISGCERNDQLHSVPRDEGPNVSLQGTISCSDQLKMFVISVRPRPDVKLVGSVSQNQEISIV